jgi:hypothetical protein
VTPSPAGWWHPVDICARHSSQVATDKGGQLSHSGVKVGAVTAQMTRLTLEQRSWEGPDGARHTKHELVATEVAASLRYAEASITRAARPLARATT